MTVDRCVVAVPALNEADRIGACLSALLDQRELDGRTALRISFRITVFANSCTDLTADIARRFGPRVDVVEATLAGAQANAGTARRLAMEHGLAQLGGASGGLICTTDADSRPRSDWLARLLAATHTGAEAVAGAVDFDPLEDIQAPFSEPRRLEAEYAALQAELSARLDPEPHNPWPNHIWAWGANLGVTQAAYRRVGGMPDQPLAEDRAFVHRLKTFDVPVRHCLDTRVWTSARREGRAPGGLASLVDDHLGSDAEPCDAALEPVATVWSRARARAALRGLRAGVGSPATLARRLRLNELDVACALHDERFGRAWARLEAASPRLIPVRIATAHLPAEIARAMRALSLLKADGPGDRSDRARAAGAGLWSNPSPPA